MLFGNAIIGPFFIKTLKINLLIRESERGLRQFFFTRTFIKFSSREGNLSLCIMNLLWNFAIQYDGIELED